VPNFLAKLVAGGLSAPVILVWWPAFFPADTVASWLARGLVWTLAVELLTHAFTPLEHALWESPAGSRLRTWATSGTQARLHADDRRRQLGSRSVLACSALAVAAALLTFAPDRPAASPAAATRQVTEIKRIVRVQRVPAKAMTVVAAGAPASAGAAPPASAPSRTPAHAGHPAPRVASPVRTQSTPTSSQTTAHQAPATAAPAPTTTAPAQPQQQPATAQAAPRREFLATAPPKRPA
jgi:hypothetical protein